jgi:CubicO group peptidase (beta-lactamase class C family)
MSADMRSPRSLWTEVRVFPAEEVTTRSPEEVDPREVGVTPEGVAEIWASVVRLYCTGLHPSIALCIRRRGRVILDRAIGHAHGNAPGAPPGGPLDPATPATLFNIYSASKSLTAMVVHLLDERGLLHLDDPVAEYLPEFGRHGKDWITLRHILTHRAGIPAIPGNVKVDLDLLSDPWRVVHLLCESHPVSVPGRRLAYHALTGGFIVGAVVERVTGRDIRTFWRDEVLDPLGFEHCGYGIEPADVGRVAENVFTGPPTVPLYSAILKKAFGVGIREACELSNDPRYLTAVVPAGNVIASANEASRFFQLLLQGGELDGVRVFGRRTVQRAIMEQTFLEVDSTIGLPVRYGMGFMLGTKYLSLWGHDTPRAFGHVGFTSVSVYADPDRDISVALMTTGKPMISLGQLTWLNVPRTIARVCSRR